MHIVTGLIATPAVLEPFSREHSLHSPVALPYDRLVILPLRRVDLDLFQDSSGDTGDLENLSERLLAMLRHASQRGSLIYFETVYTGGSGGQGAAVLQNGELIFSPH